VADSDELRWARAWHLDAAMLRDDAEIVREET